MYVHKSRTSEHTTLVRQDNSTSMYKLYPIIKYCTGNCILGQKPLNLKNAKAPKVFKVEV